MSTENDNKKQSNLPISDVSKRYFAKPDEWFKEGSECKLIEDFGDGRGLFNGVYIVGENNGYDTFWHNKGHKEGDEVTMNEVCTYDEFNVC